MASQRLTLLLLMCTIFAHNCLANCHVDDATGLLAFKSGITQDPSGMLNSWKPGTDCCTWSGVVCQDFHRVITLQLYGQVGDPKKFLSGTISPSLSKLRYLIAISFESLRNITGTFPKFLFDLPDLKFVYTSGMKLSGPLPADIGQRLSQLDSLILSENQFSGQVPSSISQLTGLTQLALDSNLFTGSIPDSIRRLENLTYLNLGRNQLSGNIPDAFAAFSELRSLILSYNRLVGEIPASISSLAPKLIYLAMSHNALTGKIPDFIGNFKALDTLDLSSNKLTGSVPNSFKNLTKIFTLNLSRNGLVDPFPELFVKGIEQLDLSYNKFNLRKIPKWVASSPIIYSLKLAGCGLRFQLDTFKPTETYFYDFIDLSDNQITGSPVGLLNKTTLLKGFWASHNWLQFNLSDLIISETLQKLDLSGNEQVLGQCPKKFPSCKG